MTAAVALDFPHRPLRAERALWWALGVSLALHALLLSLHFKFPEASRIVQDKALEIILVNSRSAHRPKDAQALPRPTSTAVATPTRTAAPRRPCRRRRGSRPAATSNTRRNAFRRSKHNSKNC